MNTTYVNFMRNEITTTTTTTTTNINIQLGSNMSLVINVPDKRFHVCFVINDLLGILQHSKIPATTDKEHPLHSSPLHSRTLLP